MALLIGILLFTILSIVSSRSIRSADPIYGQPEQIHLSYGRMLNFLILKIRYNFILVDPSLMIVTWVTLNDITGSVVEYGETDMLDQRATGYVSIFQDSGTEKRREYIHRVILQNLTPGQKYCMI
jgi:hypothetical protein